MNVVKGLPASPGIVVGEAWIYTPIKYQIEVEAIKDVPAEIARFKNAIKKAEVQLQSLEKKALETIGAEEAAIFETHQLFLQDPELTEGVTNLVREKNVNAETAVFRTFSSYADQLEMLDDPYFAARALDIRDVGQRVVHCLLGIEFDNSQLPSKPVIILADDLTPSDTVQFDKQYVLGFITVRGGPTSHTAILARSLGIPAIVSAPLDLAQITNGETLVLNGQSGDVILAPSEAKLTEINHQRGDLQLAQEIALKAAHEPAITLDGHHVEIVANVGDEIDTKRAISFGAEGVGLFRTEFLYLDRNALPTEQEQITAYQKVFDLLTDKPIVVRTLDIGGDKTVPYLGLTEEPNPFLGWRAIRMIDERPEILLGQFRALLQAGANADLRIMLPLVSNLKEVMAAKELFEEAQESLRREGKPSAEQPQFGIMVEVPSVAIMADVFAPHVDFFSIGTNDLTQYTLAVDRMNERVAKLGSPFNPAVLRLIKMTIDSAHQHGKWVGLCGAFGGDVNAVPLLLGMGLDEFSMAPSLIPEVKATIRRWSVERAQQVASQALNMASAEEVEMWVQLTITKPE
ncbi:MAG: phosphoenolpyruvate--protein phosphotransferase [Chloroflexota bacterium]